MPYCVKCGSKMDDDVIFCIKCGNRVASGRSEAVSDSVQAPASATQNEQFIQRKNSLISEYNLCARSNPFSNAKALREKWMVINNQFESLYLWSQQDPATKPYGAEIKSYADNAKARSDAYAFEYEYDEYRKALISLCKNERDTRGGDLDWSETKDLLLVYENLFDRVSWLAQNYSKFSNCDIDGRLIHDLQSNITYRYCIRLAICADNLEEERNDTLSFDTYQKCINIASFLKEGRFDLICGYAFYQQVKILETLEYEGFTLFRYKPIDNLTYRLTNEALKRFELLEDYEYCFRIVGNHCLEGKMNTCYSELSTWEWRFMDFGIARCATLCESRGDIRRKNRVIDTAIAAQDKWRRLGEDWSQHAINEYIELKSRR